MVKARMRDRKRNIRVKREIDKEKKWQIQRKKMKKKV